MEGMIRKVLDHCGYECEATIKNLEECFLDYVSSGVFGNLSLEDAEQDIQDGDITLKMMCINLLKLK